MRETVTVHRILGSSFNGCTRLIVCNGGLSAHIGDDGRIKQLWRQGYHRDELVTPEMDDWAAYALAYHDLTGSIEGFPPQEFDL
jgi:hypothetical protein